MSDEKSLPGAEPCPRAEHILSDPAASFWLKQALRSALNRDPVDAVIDVEILLRVLNRRCEESLQAGVASTFCKASSAAAPVNYIRQLQPADPPPSCHVCGALMVAINWKCLSCGASTQPSETATTAISIGEPSENLYVYGNERATRVLQEKLWELERLRTLMGHSGDGASDS